MANAFDQFEAPPAAEGNPFDNFDAPPDVSQAPDLPPDTGGQGLPAQYRDSIPAAPPDKSSDQSSNGSSGEHWYSRLLQKDPELEKLPWYQRIPAGAADALESVDPSGAIRSRLSGPTDFPAPVPFPEPSPRDSVPVAALKGAANFPSRAWDFLTSPGGAALAAGGGEALDPKIIAALFTAQQGSQAITAPNLSAQERVELALGAVAGAKGVHELGKEAVAEPQAGAELPTAEPEAAVPPPKPTTSDITLDALRWRDDLIRQQRELSQSADLERRIAGRPTGYTQRALDDVQAQLQRGYQPPELTPEPADASIATPDEQTRGIAESPDSTTAGEIAPGQQQTGDARPDGVVRPTVGGDGEAERSPAGTSNRVNTEVYGEDAVSPGEGIDTLQLLDNARADLRSGAVDPYNILSRTRARGIATPEEYAALAAEHERLVNDAVAKQKINAPDAGEAAQRAEDFANAIQPHKTAASDLMRLFQGDVNYDLSTPFGMDQYMKAEIGRTPTAAERPAFDRTSRSIDSAQTEVAKAVERSDVRVRNRYAKVRDIPIEEAAARVKEWIKDCQV